ncbi:subtilisin-like protease [Xylariaceae sp. FL0594]|nr:subtilisin-like protease [Xylariaceae sp. FL0594]
MKKTAILVGLVTLVTGIFASAPLFFKDHPDRIPDHYIVVLKNGIGRGAVQAHFDAVRTNSLAAVGKDKKGFVREYHIGDYHGYHIQCDEEALRTLREHEHVDYVYHDSTIRRQSPLPVNVGKPGPARPDTLPQSWGLGRISHRDANVSSYGHYVVPAVPACREPSVAYVVDSGVRITHQEFGGRASWGANFVNDINEDLAGHGTHVAGIIMGATTGVDNTASVIAVKVLEKNNGPVSAGIAGIDWAVQHAKNASQIQRSVINLSIGMDSCIPMNHAVDAAVAEGMTVVIAAGNDGKDACGTSPASAKSAITVGAIDRQDKRSFNFGTCLDVFAPGVDILSAFHDSDQSYANLTGTSMASPHVAGLAAYLLAREEGLASPADVAACIGRLATPGRVVDPGEGSPNLIAFNGNPDGRTGWHGKLKK